MVTLGTAAPGSQASTTRTWTWTTVTPTPPAGYTVSAEATSIDPEGDSSIQKITVTVARDGDTLLTVEDYKVDR